MREITYLEIAVIILADAIESGEWQDLGNRIREVIHYKPIKKTKIKKK